MSLLVARCAAGVAVAALRTVGVASIRDRASGAALARIMSLSTMIVLIVPALAPSQGLLVLSLICKRGRGATLNG